MKQGVQERVVAVGERALEQRQPGLDQRGDPAFALSGASESYILCGARARG
jgi:hypothetical protein